MSSKWEPGCGLSLTEDETVKVDSVKACTEACDRDEKCLQYTFDGDSCYIGKAFRLGTSKKPANGRKWWSGWRKDKLAKWAAEQSSCDISRFPSTLVNDHAW